MSVSDHAAQRRVRNRAGLGDVAPVTVGHRGNFMKNGMKSGVYAYRFTGYAMTTASGQGSYHVVGVGAMTITEDQKITGGKHSATLTRLYGQNARPYYNKYRIVQGTIAVPDNDAGIGAAYHLEIQFELEGSGPGQGNPTRQTSGEFDLVRVDENRYWLISTCKADLPPGATDEVVSGEALWIRGP
jgi:hypothetical protein